MVVEQVAPLDVVDAVTVNVPGEGCEIVPLPEFGHVMPVNVKVLAVLPLCAALTVRTSPGKLKMSVAGERITAPKATVGEGEGLGEGVGVGEGVGDAVGDGLAVGVAVGELLGVGDAVGVNVTTVGVMALEASPETCAPTVALEPAKGAPV